MADRKVTVLNPLGFQEVLQDGDTLKIGSYTDFTNLNGINTTTIVSATGKFTSDLTLEQTPTNKLHAANKEYVDTAVSNAEITLAATLPLTVTKAADSLTYTYDINYATTTTDGSVKLASAAEMEAGTSTTSVITVKNLEDRLGGLDIVDGTTTVKGLTRFATDQETIDGILTGDDRVDEEGKTIESAGEAAVSPASLRAAMDSPNYVVDCGIYAEEPETEGGD